MSESDCSEGDCGEILRELELFVDRELDSSRYEEIEAHIGRCGPCLGRAEFRRRLREIIASKCGREAVPQALADRIREMLASSGPPGQP